MKARLSGWPVILAHGFPYDVHAFDEVVPHLAQAGARVIVPFLRGFGPTRFLHKDTMRSGQQAALGHDVIDLLDALGIQRSILAGNDWGGVASCVTSALWPERVTGLVSYAGYDIVDVERLGHAFAPALEHVQWYQHLFQLERGRECLAHHRRELCRVLWAQWSPRWKFDDSTFERTASSFDNPDFVDVVIHCYRFCFGTRQATRLSHRWKPAWRQNPKSAFPPSLWMARRIRSSPMVLRTTPRCSSLVTNIVLWTAATICHGKRPMILLMRS
jgi:pimeloyl-ACP methyl ester carboxylesterase